MVVLTAAAGFYLASAGELKWGLLLHTLVGTALVAGGTAVLNQYMEREADGRMRRTVRRPLPSGRIGPRVALVFGMVLVGGGTLYLWALTNLLTAFLGWLTSAVYLLVYTPLKTRTSLCTAIGALPGAMPTLMGWAAVRGTIDPPGLLLFFILFLWQFPHFLAISWLYREDYRSGGFLMLPVLDPDGGKTGRRILWFSLGLLPCSLLPSLMGLTGTVYLLGAAGLGLWFLVVAHKTAVRPSAASAGHLLRTSVIYLPLLLVLMVLDKT